MRVSLVYPGIIGKGFNSIGQGMDSGWISHGLAILAACETRNPEAAAAAVALNVRRTTEALIELYRRDRASRR